MKCTLTQVIDSPGVECSHVEATLKEKSSPLDCTVQEKGYAMAIPDSTNKTKILRNAEGQIYW